MPSVAALNSDMRKLLDGPVLRVFLDADEVMNRSAELDAMYRSATMPPSATASGPQQKRCAQETCLDDSSQLYSPAGALRAAGGARQRESTVPGRRTLSLQRV